MARLAPGERIDLARLTALLQANGYVRTDTVADAGEYAVRGGLVDLYPVRRGCGTEARFLRRRDRERAQVRSFNAAHDRVGRWLRPVAASEALLDEGSIKRFRAGYREKFGANSTGDPLYQAVSEGRRLAGVDHWLPLLEERLATLFDHLSDDDVLVRDVGTIGAAESRFEAIADYHQNRVRAQSSDPGSYRPLEPDSLYFTPAEWDAAIAERAIHLTTPFHEPPSATVIDFEVEPARDFAPERAQNANVYEAVVDHIANLRRGKHKVVLASYSRGARERLKGLLADHGLKKVAEVDGWQEALGVSAPSSRSSRAQSRGDGIDAEVRPSTSLGTNDVGAVALAVIQLDHGFTTGDVAVLTEQDMLGDRLVRRRQRKKSTDAFLNELATLSPGDLVVHVDHGIGRYEGLTQIPVQKAPHDCVALSYAGGDKLYVPVENLEVLSRYGSESDGVALDKLGGEAWQRRKARMKDRIREIAGELIKTAAERALHPGEVMVPRHRLRRLRRSLPL